MFTSFHTWNQANVKTIFTLVHKWQLQPGNEPYHNDYMFFYFLALTFWQLQAIHRLVNYKDIHNNHNNNNHNSASGRVRFMFASLKRDGRRPVYIYCKLNTLAVTTCLYMIETTSNLLHVSLTFAIETGFAKQSRPVARAISRETLSRHWHRVHSISIRRSLL